MKSILLILLPALAFGASSSANCRAARNGDSRPCSALPSGAVTLSADEVKALVFQVEEERMARELYAAFGARWDLAPIRQIPRAEQRHEQTLRALAAQAAVALPPTQPGRFSDPLLQERYDTLLARGLVSSNEALSAGAAVERQDLADLEVLSKSAQHEALKNMVTHLTRASQRHLAAFTESGTGGPAACAGDCRGRGGACVQTGRRARI